MMRIGLQLVIFLTGNYCFFNLLTAALCLTLFDDAALLRALPFPMNRLIHQDRERHSLHGAFRHFGAPHDTA